MDQNERNQKVGSMKGFIKKLSPGLLGNWQKRYYQVQNNGANLVYYGDDKTDIPKGIIPIKILVGIQKVKKREFEFQVDKRIYSLKVKEQKDRDIWV